MLKWTNGFQRPQYSSNIYMVSLFFWSNERIIRPRAQLCIGCNQGQTIKLSKGRSHNENMGWKSETWASQEQAVEIKSIRSQSQQPRQRLKEIDAMVVSKLMLLFYQTRCSALEQIGRLLNYSAFAKHVKEVPCIMWENNWSMKIALKSVYSGPSSLSLSISIRAQRILYH